MLVLQKIHLVRCARSEHFPIQLQLYMIMTLTLFLQLLDFINCCVVNMFSPFRTPSVSIINGLSAQGYELLTKDMIEISPFRIWVFTGSQLPIIIKKYTQTSICLLPKTMRSEWI